jgi:hypothetical protein
MHCRRRGRHRPLQAEQSFALACFALLLGQELVTQSVQAADQHLDILASPAMVSAAAASA